MNVSLSIDLDFWCSPYDLSYSRAKNLFRTTYDPMHEFSRDPYWYSHFRYPLPNKKKKSMDAIIQKVVNLPKEVPVSIVRDHVEVLAFLDRETNSLVNLDSHDDICSNGARIGDGSWVTHVKWKKEASYLWVRPNSQHMSSRYCESGSADIWTHKKESSWRSIRKTTNVQKIDWPSVVCVTIALSPDFTYPTTGLYFMTEIRKREGLHIDSNVYDVEKMWLILAGFSSLNY